VIKTKYTNIYIRNNGEYGIRNHLLVMYTTGCAYTIANKIAMTVNAKLIGQLGCKANLGAYQKLVQLGSHPNVGAVLIVSLGCEHIDYERLKEDISQTQKPIELLVIQKEGGTSLCVEKGINIALKLKDKLSQVQSQVVENINILVGIECGGSDSTSGIISNPAVGFAADKVIENGGRVVVEELRELLGCERDFKKKCMNEEVEKHVLRSLKKAKDFSNRVGEFEISPGNQSGGLSTIEEKSLGALFKLGSKRIRNVISKGERIPNESGLYILDRIRNLNDLEIFLCDHGDASGLVDLTASGAQVLIFTTGRGTPVGNPISPVIKVCSNPLSCKTLDENIDVRLDNFFIKSNFKEPSIELFGLEVYGKLIDVINGSLTKSEILNHNEY